MDQPDDRDAIIAELREKLDQERSYSQMVEVYVKTKIEEVVDQLVDQRLQVKVDAAVQDKLGDFDWLSFRDRFQQWKSGSDTNYNIDTALDRMEGDLMMIRYTALPKLGIDPVSFEPESKFD